MSPVSEHVARERNVRTTSLLRRRLFNSLSGLSLCWTSFLDMLLAVEYFPGMCTFEQQLSPLFDISISVISLAALVSVSLSFAFLDTINTAITST